MNTLRCVLFASLLVTLPGLTGCGITGLLTPPAPTPSGPPLGPMTPTPYPPSDPPLGPMTPTPFPPSDPPVGPMTPTPLPTSTTQTGGPLSGATVTGADTVSVGFGVWEAPRGWDAPQIPLDFSWKKALPAVHVDVLMNSRRSALVTVKGGGPDMSVQYRTEPIAGDARFDTRLKIDIKMRPDTAMIAGSLCVICVQPDDKMEPIPFSPVRPLEPDRQTNFDLLTDGGLQPVARTGETRPLRDWAPLQD